MEELTTRLNKLSLLDQDVADFILHSKWDGVEESDSLNDYDNTVQQEIKVYSFLIEKLKEKGILFSDPSDMCIEGCYKNVLCILFQLFNRDNLLNMLYRLPETVVDRLSQTVYSDEIPTEDVLDSVVQVLHQELPLDTDLIFLNYYLDLYHCNETFVKYMQDILDVYRKNYKVSTDFRSTDEDIKNYIDLVSKHRKDVEFIVNLIVTKTNYTFDNDLISKLLNQHDNDLLDESCLGYFAFDKSLNKDITYHSFNSHPAIDLFHGHVIKSPHHIEFYVSRLKNIESVEYLALTLADLYTPGETLSNYKSRVKELTENVSIFYDMKQEVENFLSVINILPG